MYKYMIVNSAYRLKACLCLEQNSIAVDSTTLGKHDHNERSDMRIFCGLYLFPFTRINLRTYVYQQVQLEHSLTSLAGMTSFGMIHFMLPITLLH